VPCYQGKTLNKVLSFAVPGARLIECNVQSSWHVGLKEEEPPQKLIMHHATQNPAISLSEYQAPRQRALRAIFASNVGMIGKAKRTAIGGTTNTGI